MATITISREYGSGGDEVATLVSEKLGYRYFDKSLMAKMVSESGLSESEIVDFTEDNYKVRGFLDRLLAWRGAREITQVSSWSEEITGTRKRETSILNEAQGVALVQGAIRAAHQKGNVVIVGRGSQVILKALPGVLHVRIHAPLETRFEHIAASGNIHHFGLRKEITEHDEAAADYVKRFYSVDWTDPTLYDLVINTSRLNVEAVVQIIVDAVKFLPVPETIAEVVM
jgi:CMP/dCMP kinase